MSRQYAATSSGPSLNASSASAHARRRQAGAAYVEQEWQRAASTSGTATAYDEFGGAGAEWDETGDGNGAEEWECVACGKTFRSEKAWGNHERSNKHLKEVEKYV